MTVFAAALQRTAHAARAMHAAAGVPGLVRLTKGKARLFKQSGHPIVYGGAIDKVEGKPEPGGVVDVVDGAGGLIGWGVFNPHSMYRVRLLATDELDLLEHRDVDKVLEHRLTAAAQLRAACGMPSADTNAYRLVNSEGDRLSGLTVDVFAGTAVAVSSALWLEQRRDLVVEVLERTPGVERVVWRRSDGRLQQDGWKAPSKAGATEEAVEDSAPAAPAPPPDDPQQVEIRESGLRYLVAPALGQKSGFYCDQRDNRRLLAELCEGKDVLDLFCYTGGFAISAAAAGAASCVGVDSSARAVDLAAQNAALNAVGVPRCTFVKADVHKYLKGDGDDRHHRHGGEGDRGGREGAAAAPVRKPDELYDVVICDPPKFAPSVKDLPRATRKYRALNAGAMRALKPGGLLLSCTCSAAMTQSGGLVKVLTEAASNEGRSITVVRVTGAASDHVLNPGCPESSYLTAVLAYVH